jgi:predicted N-acetyltransferase YhbS
MITIRRATPADIGAVDAMFARSYGPLLRADYPPSALVVALPRIARAQPGLLASGRYLLAELEGAVVGAGGWSPEAPGNGRRDPGLGHVRHVATDYRATRRGVGRAVMEAVLTDARDAGMARLSCLSTLTAVPFYRALGFRALRAVDLSFGAGIAFPAVEMDRDL